MPTEPLAVGVVGAGSVVGGEIASLLTERQFPVARLRFLGSERTAGRSVEHEGRAVAVERLGPQSFAGLDVVFFAAGPTVSGAYAPAAAAAGATVIDCSSCFRIDDAVPLVVPEVNPERIADRAERGIVANPSSTAIGLAVVLAPLAAEAGLRRVVASTYQGVAAAWRRGLTALSRETVALLNTQGEPRPHFARRIAFNCIPQVGTVERGGATTHELLVVEETRRILGDPGLGMQITAVRVPVFFGAAMSVVVETDRPLGAAGARAVLRAARGVFLHDGAGDAYPTLADVVGSQAVHVGRLRDDPSVEHGVALWIALDSVRKGAALNAVEIAEILARDYL